MSRIAGLLRHRENVKHHAGQVARHLHLVPYRTERWTLAEWQSAYQSGRFDYFSSLQELPRYAMLAGYLTMFAEGRSLLDVGCGKGLLRAHLAGLDFASYTGIDLSSAAIDAAQTLADGRTVFICGDVTEVDLAPVQIVVLNEVLYFAPDPSRMLDAVDRALGGEGLVLTCMWRHAGDEALWTLLHRRYEVIDITDIRNRANTVAKRGWRVACHRLKRAS